MTSSRIYLNNAATSYPKPPEVVRAVASFMTDGGANYSRGSSSGSDFETMSLVLECRETIAEFFGEYDSSLVTLTQNITQSLNTVLKGFLKPGMRALSTTMEHNAVNRPLRSLEDLGCEVDLVECDGDGYLDPSDMERAIRAKRTDLVVMSTASNVCGSVQDFGAVSRICAAEGVPLVLDAAQSAGHMVIDVRETPCAALCFTGHKGLLGPQGTGGIIWEKDFARKCAPFIEGGTGSFSHDEHQPEAMPDKFESGTPNMPGIAGLCAALESIMAMGIETIARAEDRACDMLIEGIRGIRGARLHGADTSRRRVPVVAMNFERIDNARAADILSREFGIETRPGLHCAPRAHKTLGSFPSGALRLSPGHLTTDEEIERTIAALSTIASRTA